MERVGHAKTGGLSLENIHRWTSNLKYCMAKICNRRLKNQKIGQGEKQGEEVRSSLKFSAEIKVIGVSGERTKNCRDRATAERKGGSH